MLIKAAMKMYLSAQSITFRRKKLKCYTINFNSLYLKTKHYSLKVYAYLFMMYICLYVNVEMITPLFKLINLTFRQSIKLWSNLPPV